MRHHFTKVIILHYLFIALTSISLGSEINSQKTDDIIEISCAKPLEISNIYPNQKRVYQYRRFELTFDLAGHWDNPFNPTQIMVDGLFKTPGGKEVAVPGFFYQDYKKTTKNGEDYFKPIGNPVWKIRFAPSEVGEYYYRIKIRNKKQEIITQEDTFLCQTSSMNHGFVRVSKTNPLYFEYDDGAPFFGIANCKWWDKMNEMEKIPGYNELGDIEALFTEFARSGGNMTRNFLSRIGELVDPSTPRPDRGFGKMDLERSWRHDESFELCENLGVHHQVAISNGTYFLPGQHEVKKKQLVYNVWHGGPFEDITAKEYLTHPLARENFKNILRYFVARWGYSTAIFSWNLWNEVDLIPQFFDLQDEIIAWHREMANYLEQVDWANHVVHTNYSKVNGSPVLDTLPEMEIISINKYTSLDFTSLVEYWITRHLSDYQKPVMFSEFGIQPMSSEGYLPHDPKSIMLHNGMWSSLMSGSASTGMPFGRNWLQTDEYFNYVSAIARFTKDVPFNKSEWKPVVINSFQFSGALKTIYYTDKFLEGCSASYYFPEGWKDRETFNVEQDGQIRDIEYMSAFLGPSTGKKENVLKINYPVDGSFTVFVPTVYKNRKFPGFPVITVSLDNKKVIEEIVPDDTLSPRYHPYKKYTISVPQGEHTIKLANRGGGSILTGYELGNYLQKDGPNLEVRGIQSDDVILLWLKSPKLTWLYDKMSILPELQPPGKLTIENVPDGTWVAEWMDTIENEQVQCTIEKSENGKLVIITPMLTKSIAVKIIKRVNRTYEKM